jgi:hypothetical protein
MHFTACNRGSLRATVVHCEQPWLPRMHYAQGCVAAWVLPLLCTFLALCIGQLRVPLCVLDVPCPTQISDKTLIPLTSAAITTHAHNPFVLGPALALLVRIAGDATRRPALMVVVDQVVGVLQLATAPTSPAKLAPMACAAVEFLAGLAADPTNRPALGRLLPLVQVRDGKGALWARGGHWHEVSLTGLWSLTLPEPSQTQ